MKCIFNKLFLYNKLITKKFYFNYKKIKIILIIISLLISLNLFNINNNLNYINFKLRNIYDNSLNKTINIGLVVTSIKNGGVERTSSLICHYLNMVKYFKLFLFTLTKKENNEFDIDSNIERIIIKNNLIQVINLTKVEILIYQFYNYIEIDELNKLSYLKIILINHSCFLHWIYYNRFFQYNTYYRAYKSSKYTISLVPFENDYLFRKWGINSIFMPNFIPYEYNEITPSDLSSNIILMIGRASDKIKRFDLGIRAMKHIISEIPQSEMKLNNYITSLIIKNYDFKFKWYRSFR